MRLASVLCAALLWAGAAVAQTPQPTPPPAQPPTLTVEGRVARTLVFDDATLALSRTAEATIPARGDTSAQHLVGVLLWPMIAAAEPLDETPRTRLQHTILARGTDGYAVALSLAELDPDFEGKPVLVVTEINGATLPRPRLYVPGDVKAGRSVRDLVLIEVR